MRLLSPILVLFAAWLLLAGCSKEPEGPVVLAAASLQDALTEVADAWAGQGHPAPVLSFAGSSALARQIESGAPADIFISADEEWMDTLEKRARLKPGTRKTFLANALVLIVPTRSVIYMDVPGPRSVNLADRDRVIAALFGGRLAMADPETVPAGKYGKAALENLGLWDELKDRIAPAENVRAALALVERAEAHLGIVYWTDAEASKDVKIVALFPEASQPRIGYPLAVVKTSENPEAESFRDFLVSEEALAIFARYGFRRP